MLSNLASVAAAATGWASARAISISIRASRGCSSRSSARASCTSTGSTTTARWPASRCSSRTRSRTAPTTRPRRWRARSTSIRTAASSIMTNRNSGTGGARRQEGVQGRREQRRGVLDRSGDRRADADPEHRGADQPPAHLRHRSERTPADRRQHPADGDARRLDAAGRRWCSTASATTAGSTFARKYDVDTGRFMQFWTGIVTLRVARGIVAFAALAARAETCLACPDSGRNAMKESRPLPPRSSLACAAARAGAGLSRPRRSSLISGFPAGTTADISARVVGAKMGQILGQQVVVENRPGAASSIAGAQVARAPKDGYTLYIASAANMINAAMSTNLQLRHHEGLRADHAAHLDADRAGGDARARRQERQGADRARQGEARARFRSAPPASAARRIWRSSCSSRWPA